MLNEVTNKRKSKSLLPSSFASKGKTITDPVEIADKFCKYFTNIGPNLATLVPEVFLDFSLRKRSRANREAATASCERDEEREKNLWLPWPRISLS